MGCDIHGTVEVIHGKTDYVWFVMELPNDRRYAWFSTLAGVRNYHNLKVLSEPRGMPSNATITTTELYKEAEGDYHSISYLTFKELKEIDWTQIVPYENHPMGLGEAIGSVWYGLFLMLGCMAREYGEDKVRIVFWFDN